MSLASLCSVVIPTHNTRQLTLECVGSIAGAPAVQVTVVDDGGDDGTAEAVKERFPGVEIVRLEASAGFTAAANAGLAQARGDLLVLLNSDTRTSPGALRALRLRMERDRGLGVGGARLSFPDGRPQWSGGDEPGLAWFFALASGLPRLLERVPGFRRIRPVAGSGKSPGDVAWVTGAAMAFRRQVWEQVGPLDESFRFYCQDLDFCLRARQAGWQVAVVPDFEVVHHHGATIGREAGALPHQHVEILWNDLVLWARKRRGPAHARFVAKVLRWGGQLRLAGRALRALLLPRPRRDAWRRGSLAYRRAVASLYDE